MGPLLVSPAKGDSSPCYVISNEQNGYLIGKFAAAGYGAYSLRDVLQAVRASADASIKNVITDTFVSAASASPHFVDGFPTFYETRSNGLLLCTDGPRGLVRLYGRAYPGQPGISTTIVNIAGVGQANIVYSSAGTPLPSIGNVPAPENTMFILYAPLLPTFDTWVISNEGNGSYISQLVAAGYGDSTLGPEFVNNVAFPTSFKDPFIDLLRDNPPGVAINTTMLKTVNVPGQAVAISNDGSVQIVNIFGSTYQGKPGTFTTPIPSPSAPNAKVVSAGSGVLTSFHAGGNTYNVRVIAFSGTDQPTVVPAPSSSILTLAGLLVLLASEWARRRRARCPGRDS